MTSNDTLVDQRPFYFTHIAVDPKNPDKVYAVSEETSVSTDGGKKFKAIADQVHVDYHAIWIAPNDPNRVMLGEDGGYALTVDGGQNWFFSQNLPIAQVYRVGLSNENPYWVCAGLQDNNGWCAPNNTQDPSGIQNKAWIAAAGGDGEWAVPDPIDPNYLWADSENGVVTVINKQTKDGWFVQPYLQLAAEAFDNRQAKVRWNWESPIAFAPWNRHIGWIGGNVLFQTTDRGLHWKIISPDLTRNDKAHQAPSGGPITHDVSGAEEIDTILDIEGSTLHKGEIWVGTDDGLVQLTLDGGKHWQNVTPPGGAEFGRYASISPSPIADGTAYADQRRALYRRQQAVRLRNARLRQTLEQRSRTACPPMNGRAASLPTSTIRTSPISEPKRAFGFRSTAAAKWEQFKNNLPTVSVHDIRMQPQFDDLVIATHGRSVYIMDDMTPIQNLQTAIAQGTYMFPIRTAYQYNQREDDEGTYTDYAAAESAERRHHRLLPEDAGEGCPETRDSRSIAVALSVRTKARTKSATSRSRGFRTIAGLNRFVWDFRLKDP